MQAPLQCGFGSAGEMLSYSVSCCGHPGAPGSGWLCLCPAELKPVEFLHKLAWVPSAFGAGR